MEIINTNKEIENIDEVAKKIEELIGVLHDKIGRYYEEVRLEPRLLISLGLLDGVEIIHSTPAHYEKVNARVALTIYKSGSNILLRIHSFNPTYPICELGGLMV